jgi:hypothetical protein
MTENGDVVPTQVELIVAQLRALVDDRQTALAQHDLIRNQLTTELRQAEKALAAFQGEPRKAGRPKQPSEPGQARPKGLSDERLVEIEAVIREYAQEHEEFRQVDVRSAYGTLPSGASFTSGMAAIAFERLRQEPYNVLRFARKDGNNKYFRLTAREAVAA